jgi:hypothetical protein
MDWLYGLMDRLPALSRDKSPNVAAFIGFVFGGLGLGIFFRSFVDFLIPIGIVLAVNLLYGSLATSDYWIGVLTGSIIAAVYGAVRAKNSNDRRHQLMGSPGPFAH